jgi:hypothetical protein
MGAPPRWLDRFVREISTMVRSYDNAPLGCHYHLAQDCWEITVFVMRVEVVGGGRDGETLVLPYHLDLPSVPLLFDEVETFTWQTARFGRNDDLGQHISVTGRVGEDAVWLRIMADAPEQTPTAGTLCASTLNFQPA